MKVCRPSGYFKHDLESMGRVPPTIIRVAGKDPADCFERLKEGSVDIVTVNADTSDRMITELDLSGEVEEIIDLATIQTLHVVAMKSNPKSRVNLLRLNKRLKGLQMDGTFKKIAAKHLSASLQPPTGYPAVVLLLARLTQRGFLACVLPFGQGAEVEIQPAKGKN